MIDKKFFLPHLLMFLGCNSIVHKDKMNKDSDKQSRSNDSNNFKKPNPPSDGGNNYDNSSFRPRSEANAGRLDYIKAARTARDNADRKRNNPK